MVFKVEGKKQTLQSLLVEVSRVTELRDCTIRVPEFYKFARSRDWLNIELEIGNGSALIQLLCAKRYHGLVVKTKDTRSIVERDLVKPANKTVFYPVKKSEVKRVEKRNEILHVRKEAEVAEEPNELQEFEELEQWEERLQRG